MKKLLVRLSIMAFTFLVCGPGYRCLAATAGTASTKMLGPVRVEQYGVFNAVKEISEKTRVPIGIDAILPAKEPTIVLDFPGGTVADLLNMLVTVVPDYGWSEDHDGVIHVSRKNAEISLLNMVMYYPGSEKKTRQQIWEDLSNRPEISQWLRSNNCSRQEFFIGNEFKRNNDPISIAPGPMTVRQLFDEVAIKSGADSWAVLESAGPSSSCRVSLMLW